MRTNKIITLALFATLPFFAACASWETAGIANRLDDKRLTYEQAKLAIENGANVKEPFAGKCFLKQAVEQNRRDLVELFVENGADPWFARRKSNKFFSLFDYAIEHEDEEYLDLCFAHVDANPSAAEMKSLKLAEKLFRSGTPEDEAILEKISNAGLAKPIIDKWKAKKEEERIAREKEIARQKAEAERRERERLAAIEAAKRAEEERIAREKAEAEERERQRIEAEKRAEEERIAREKAEAERKEQERLAAIEAAKRAEEERIAREKAEAEERERQRIEAEKRAEEERIAREKAEAERKEQERLAAIEAAKRAEEERIAREKAEAEAREQARRDAVKEEKERNLERIDEILKNNDDLSKEERSRGVATLEAFGNEHLPFFMEKYRAARTKALEAEQNFNEIFNELRSENPQIVDVKRFLKVLEEKYQATRDKNEKDRLQALKEFVEHSSWSESAYEKRNAQLLAVANQNETALVLYKNMHEQQAIYWTIFYKIVDQYSQFKIGVLTADDLVKIDEELCELYQF